MKLSTYCSVVIFLTLLSFPMTTDAFSRRPHHSEVGQNQVTPLDTKNYQSPNGTPQAVPEPSSLLLFGLGILVIATYAIAKRFRGQGA